MLPTPEPGLERACMVLKNPSPLAACGKPGCLQWAPLARTWKWFRNRLLHYLTFCKVSMKSRSISICTWCLGMPPTFYSNTIQYRPSILQAVFKSIQTLWLWKLRGKWGHWPCFAPGPYSASQIPQYQEKLRKEPADSSPGLPLEAHWTSWSLADTPCAWSEKCNGWPHGLTLCQVSGKTSPSQFRTRCQPLELWQDTAVIVESRGLVCAVLELQRKTLPFLHTCWLITHSSLKCIEQNISKIRALCLRYTASCIKLQPWNQKQQPWGNLHSGRKTPSLWGRQSQQDENNVLVSRQRKVKPYYT